MIVTIAWIEKNYNKFNNLYWNGMLPNISFKTSRSRNTWGFASYRYDFKNNTIIPLAITLSNYYDSPENVKIQTLLHEMIHIADYTFHPEHFIYNGHKVSARSYDAHGYWFNTEAKRLTKESGYKIANHVTKEEVGCSKLSESTIRRQENKKNNAIICVVYGTSGTNFYFKTDIYKIKLLNATIKSYTFYRIGDIKKVKYYTFDDIKLAEMRSCGVRLRGWFADNAKTMQKLKNIKATEVRF
jgi:hypothetical protein